MKEQITRQCIKHGHFKAVVKNGDSNLHEYLTRMNLEQQKIVADSEEKLTKVQRHIHIYTYIYNVY